MKRKYQVIASFVVFTVSLTGMVCYAIYFATALPGTVHMSAPPSLPDLDIPDKKVLAYIDYIKLHLADLAHLKKNIGGVNLKLFGYKPVPEEPIQKDRPMEMENGFSYALTLAFFSKKHRFCVINGKLYPEKAILPDGGKIEQITNNKVLISKNNKKAWIYTSHNLHQLSRIQNKEKTVEKKIAEKKTVKKNKTTQ